MLWTGETMRQRFSMSETVSMGNKTIEMPTVFLEAYEKSTLLVKTQFLWAKSPLFECGSRSPWFSHQHHRGQHEPLADVQHAVHVVISAFPGDLHRLMEVKQ